MKEKKKITAIPIGIILGFIMGCAIFLYNIITHFYIQYNMFRITIYHLKKFLNSNIFLFFSAFLALHILEFLIMKKTKLDENKARLLKVMGRTVLAALLIIDQSFKYYFNFTLLKALKRFTNITGNLLIGKLSINYLLNLVERRKIAIIILFGCIIVILLFYRLLTKINYKKISINIKARYIQGAALVIIISLMLLNLGIFIDNKINRAEKLNVIWFLIDALRADHLGCYGYENDTSPFMDRFADESILFKYAFSQESYTQASVPSYFTSTYPPFNKVLYDQPTIDILDSRFVTIAETLKNENYNTAAFVFNPHLKEQFNFGQGFDLYDDNKQGFDLSLPYHEAFETAQKIYEKTKRYLKENKKRPIFLYLHYRDVHTPYSPPPPYHKLFLPSNIKPVVDIIQKKRIPDEYNKKNRDLVVSQYDGEIRYTDYYIEKTLDMLENYSINLKNSIIIITADHGEEFLDYHPGDPGGRYHGRTLYKEQIHVPLIISIPGLQAKKKIIDSCVELMDIAPTILDAVGVNWKKYNQFQGKSLIPLIEGVNISSRVIYSGGNHSRSAVIEGAYKYCIYDKYTKENRKKCFIRPSNDYDYIFREELYNIKVDPNETKNVINEEKNIALGLKKRLLVLQEIFPIKKDSKSIELDNKTIEQLKSLGYIN